MLTLFGGLPYTVSNIVITLYHLPSFMFFTASSLLVCLFIYLLPLPVCLLHELHKLRDGRELFLFHFLTSST